MQHYVIKVRQLLATGQWFSPRTPVSSTNKTDRHDITEILFQVALNTINQTQFIHLYIQIVHVFIIGPTVCQDSVRGIKWTRQP